MGARVRPVALRPELITLVTGATDPSPNEAGGLALRSTVGARVDSLRLKAAPFPVRLRPVPCGTLRHWADAALAGC